MFDIGLTYICQTPERFYAVSSVLSFMVNDNPTPRLLKHIIRCYLRLSDHQRARVALKQCLPDSLRDNTFASLFHEDKTVKTWLMSLLVNIGDIAVPTGSGAAAVGNPYASAFDMGVGAPSMDSNGM